MSNEINLEGRLYQNGGAVYFGYKALKVHTQKGRLFVCYKDRQVNIKDIPVLPKPATDDYVFDYICNGGSQNYPCSAMDYWIHRHRRGIRIGYKEFKQKFNVQAKVTQWN